MSNVQAIRSKFRLSESSSTSGYVPTIEELIQRHRERNQYSQEGAKKEAARVAIVGRLFVQKNLPAFHAASSALTPILVYPFYDFITISGTEVLIPTTRVLPPSTDPGFKEMSLTVAVEFATAIIAEISNLSARAERWASVYSGNEKTLYMEIFRAVMYAKAMYMVVNMLQGHQKEHFDLNNSTRLSSPSETTEATLNKLFGKYKRDEAIEELGKDSLVSRFLGPVYRIVLILSGKVKSGDDLLGPTTSVSRDIILEALQAQQLDLNLRAIVDASKIYTIPIPPVLKHLKDVVDIKDMGGQGRGIFSGNADLRVSVEGEVYVPVENLVLNAVSESVSMAARRLSADPRFLKERHGIIVPWFVPKKQRGLIILDTSGSMQTKYNDMTLLEWAVKVIRGVMRSAGVDAYVAYGDTHVEGIIKLDESSHQKILDLGGGGGTSMRNAFIEATKKSVALLGTVPSTAIIVTDGATDWPTEGDVPNGVRVIGIVLDTSADKNTVEHEGPVQILRVSLSEVARSINMGTVR